MRNEKRNERNEKRNSLPKQFQIFIFTALQTSKKQDDPLFFGKKKNSRNFINLIFSKYFLVSAKSHFPLFPLFPLLLLNQNCTPVRDVQYRKKLNIIK